MFDWSFNGIFVMYKTNAANVFNKRCNFFNNFPGENYLAPLSHSTLRPHSPHLLSSFFSILRLSLAGALKTGVKSASFFVYVYTHTRPAVQRKRRKKASLALYTHSPEAS